MTISKRKINAIKSVFLVAIAAILVFPFDSVLAVGSRWFVDDFSANNIMFYDPEDCETGTSGGGIVGGDAVVSGSSAAEKVWSGLKSMGLSDEVTAGIMGNMMHESNSFNPAQHEGSFYSRWENFDLENDTSTSYGIGLIQWSFGRRTNVYKYIKERSPGLLKYLDNPKTYSYENGNVYGCNGDCFIKKAASESEADALFSLELSFLVNEELSTNSTYGGVLTQTTVYNAAKYFLEKIEVPQNPTIDYHPERATDAQKFYDQFHGKTSFGAGSNGGAATAVSGSNVTVIGDSITNSSYTRKAYENKLNGADIHAQDSKHFKMDGGASTGGDSGLTILKQLQGENKVRDYLVFALGTNDDEVTQSMIDEVMSTASNAKRVIFVTQYTTSKDYSKSNEAIKKAAAGNTKIGVADWASAIKADPGKYLGDGTHPKNQEASDLLVNLIVTALGNNLTAMSSDECCDPASSSTLQDVWGGNKFDLSDGEIRGITAVAKAENGGTLHALQFEISIMANLYEYYNKDSSKNLAQWLKGASWFDIDSRSQYSESYNGASASEFAAVKDILINGNRTIPPEILEHDSFGDIKYIKINGTTYSDHDAIYSMSNYKRGETIIKALGDEYVFYEFANPDGTKISDSSDGGGTGDPFGYFVGHEPKGNSQKGAGADACCDYMPGTSKKMINGIEYAFPLAGATKENYLDPGKGADYSVLSHVPCTPSSNMCHHDYYALDMGLNMNMVNGKAKTASDYGNGSSFSDMYYYSDGAQVVAITGGTITTARRTYSLAAAGWEDKCGSITLKGDDGNIYWMGHLSGPSIKVNDGDKVKAGDVLAEVGAPQCAQNTQSHLHIDTKSAGASKDGETWINEVMNQLWEAIPDSGNGTGVVQCSANGLKVGGMSLDDAKEYMKEYRKLMEANQGKNWFSVTTVNGDTDTFSGISCSDNNDGVPNAMKNCVSFSWWFLRKYVDHDVPRPIGNGQDVVGNLKSAGYPTGTEPRPYAIFSWSKGEYGHTGVVLGVKDENTFIVGESSCSANWKDDWAAHAAEYTLDDGHDWTFAYTDDWIKL